MLRKSLIQFFVDGWGCFPSLLFGLRPNCWPMPSQETRGRSQASLTQSLVDTAPFSWLLVHARFCLCSPRVCFPSPVKVLQSNPTDALSQISWGFSVPLLDPQVGKSVVGPRTLLTVWDFFSIIVLQFVGRLLYGFMLGNVVWPTSAAARAPVPVAGHC